jgi:arylsulfatase A-like enzyme
MVLPPAVDRTTQTIDIAPTILDLIGLDIPTYVQGTSLLQDDVHPVVAQHYVDEHIQEWYGGRFSTEQVAVMWDGLKFISGSDDSEELYDLLSDEAEDRNLVPLATERLSRYRGLLHEWGASVEKKVHPEDATPTMDLETLQQLEALGYVR